MNEDIAMGTRLNCPTGATCSLSAPRPRPVMISPACRPLQPARALVYSDGAAVGTRGYTGICFLGGSSMNVKQVLSAIATGATFAVLAGMLAGCGGGGDDGGGRSGAVQSSPTPPNPDSVPAPPEPFTIGSTQLGVNSGGNSYAGTYSETPNKGTTMFDGQEANSSTISLTITENGSPIITEIETTYYLENPYQPLGVTLSYNGGQFDLLYKSTNPLPSTLTVGSSGPLDSGTFYDVNTHDAIGSLTETYSVTSSNGWILLNTDATGTVNGQSISQTISYVINSGEATGVASVEVLVNGTTLSFNTDCAGCWDY
jgi:hypothetical protein